MKRHAGPADDRSSGLPEAAAADVGIRVDRGAS